MYFESQVDYGKNRTYARGLSRQETRELVSFLSIGLDGLSLQKSKQLSRELQLKKEKKLARSRAIKIVRPLLRDRKLSKKILLILERSGLSLQQQRVFLKRIRKLLLDFGRDVHNQLDLRGLNLQLLPLSLRRFIIALQVLKAEIVHLFRLNREMDFKRIQLERTPTLSIDSRVRYVPLKRDFREIYSTGVSRTLGSYAGRLSYAQRNRLSAFDRKTARNRTDLSKKTRNTASNKSKNYKKYKSNNYNKSNGVACTDSRDYYYKYLQSRKR